jgi:hypothetical protein
VLLFPNGPADLVAAPLLWSSVIEGVNPTISRKFGSRFDRQGLVHVPPILEHRVGIIDTGPQNGSTHFRHDRQTQIRKVGTAAGLHIAQVNEKGQDARTTLPICSSERVSKQVHLLDFTANDPSKQAIQKQAYFAFSYLFDEECSHGAYCNTDPLHTSTAANLHYFQLESA